MPRTCPECGVEISGTGKVCHNCHTIFRDPLPTEAPPPEPPAADDGPRFKLRQDAKETSDEPGQQLSDFAPGYGAKRPVPQYEPPPGAVRAQKPVEKPAPPASRPLELSIFIVIYDVLILFVLVILFPVLLTFLMIAPNPLTMIAGAVFVLYLFLLVMLHALWRGKPWGHIGTTILVALQILAQVGRLLAGAPRTGQIIFLIVFQGVFLLVLWMPPTRRYVNWSSSRR